jgi:predicted RNA-binding protein YlqC (UPF0109 family)
METVAQFLEERDKESTDTVVWRVAEMISWVAEDPNQVQIVVTEGMSKILVELVVLRGDAGKVIGYKGAIIDAVRTLARSGSPDRNKNYDISIVDPERR